MAERGAQRGRKGDFTLSSPTPPLDGRATDGHRGSTMARLPRVPFRRHVPKGMRRDALPAHPPALWSVRRAPARIGHLPTPRLYAARIIPIGNQKPHDPTGTFPVESRQTHEKAPRSAPYIRDDRFIGWREKRVRGAVRGQYGDLGKGGGWERVQKNIGMGTDVTPGPLPLGLFPRIAGSR